MTPNEAARRLAVLAESGLTINDYDRAAALADGLPGGFVEAVQYLAWTRTHD